MISSLQHILIKSTIKDLFKAKALCSWYFHLIYYGVTASATSTIVMIMIKPLSVPHTTQRCIYSINNNPSKLAFDLHVYAMYVLIRCEVTYKC